MIFSNLVHHEGTKRSESAHISEDWNPQFLKLLNLKWRRFEVLDGRKDSSLCIPDFVVVPFQGLEVGHHCFIDSSVKPDMSDIVSCPSAFSLVGQVCRHFAIMDDWFVVVLGDWDPHDLHLPVFVGEAEMDLLWPVFSSDFNPG